MYYYLDVDPVAEVRRNRESILEQYGGMEGWHKHLKEQRPQLEAQGWKFMTVEEVSALNQANALARNE